MEKLAGQTRRNMTIACNSAILAGIVQSTDYNPENY